MRRARFVCFRFKVRPLAAGKREHGAAYPTGTKTMAAPATVTVEPA